MRTFGTHTISYPKQCISTVSLHLYHCELVFDEPYNTVVVRSGFGCSGVSDGYSDASGIVIYYIIKPYKIIQCSSKRSVL